jgi:NAD(P)-dependent dehydrogenase (short-subunit alcohol dehydrogenase family)
MSLQGKICLLTGATLGIGRATALGLARQGATLVIVGRDAARTRETADVLRRGTGNGNIDFLVADLSSQAEVRRLAATFKERYSRLDVLLNNAGAIFTERRLSVDGFEYTWALNHLAYFTLTLELLDLLKASAPSRIVNVASDAHRGGHLDFDDLQAEKGFRSMQVYCRSKLANVAFTYALARRLEGTRVTVNALHPGVVASGFGKNDGALLKWGMTLLRPFLISPEKGAKTSIYLASSPEVEGISGRYFVKCRERSSSPESYDESVQERLFRVSLEQTGLSAEKCGASAGSNE